MTTAPTRPDSRVGGLSRRSEGSAFWFNRRGRLRRGARLRELLRARSSTAPDWYNNQGGS